MKNNKHSLVQNLARYFLVIVLFLVAALFGIIESRFFNVTNIMDILRTSSVIGMLTLSMMACMITGDMNFALGVQATIAAAVVGNVMASPINNYPLAIILAVLVSVGISALTAFFVIQLKVPAFIGTLALQIALNGLAKSMTGNTTMFSDKWGEGYVRLGQGYVFGIIPNPVIVFVIVVIIMWIYFEKTRSGRYIFALGANATACKQMGINIKMEKLKGYLISGALAAIVGIVQTSISNNVSIKLGGDMLLPAISGTMLGATFLVPGKYNVAGSVIAAVLLVLVENGVMNLGGSMYVKDIFQGIILMVAMGIIARVRKEGLPSVRFES